MGSVYNWTLTHHSVYGTDSRILNFQCNVCKTKSLGLVDFDAMWSNMQLSHLALLITVVLLLLLSFPLDFSCSTGSLSSFLQFYSSLIRSPCPFFIARIQWETVPKTFAEYITYSHICRTRHLIIETVTSVRWFAKNYLFVFLFKY